MPESLVQVPEGVGKKLHTWQTTIGANAVEDEFTLPGEFPYPSYIAQAFAISTATANDHILQLMAPAGAKVRIRKISIEQASNATAAALDNFSLFRLTTAGTGGTAVTPRPFDTADTAGAQAMTLPTVKGTEGVELLRTTLILRQTIGTTSTQPDDYWEWEQLPGQKPIIIPAGVANGVAIKNLNAIAGATIHVRIEFVETAF